MHQGSHQGCNAVLTEWQAPSRQLPVCFCVLPALPGRRWLRSILPGRRWFPSKLQGRRWLRLIHTARTTLAPLLAARTALAPSHVFTWSAQGSVLVRRFSEPRLLFRCSYSLRRNPFEMIETRSRRMRHAWRPGARECALRLHKWRIHLRTDLDDRNEEAGLRRTRTLWHTVLWFSNVASVTLDASNVAFQSVRIRQQ